ncbi:thiamine pyrophosphate-dependent enzyme [Streptomyces sulphureus]|uniref:thiamine pyrophosphate-dependent enzyme n=1 Tax=Streptomyces sulphureus TaxID=47758 RepID=UPI00036AF15E|nr:thiamine pyrophosphate-dependent enzyme [Streptomyces sulphureus]
MNSETAPRPGGHAVVEQLLEHGVDRAFGVPGESYLAVLDGLYEHREAIDMVVTRQEGGAAMMAAAHGRLTGRPGVCLVTRGPGATNASIGVHVASQDASPMVLFVGQVPRSRRGTRAFQEIDYAAMFGTVAKEVVEIDLPERVPELVARALTTAVAGEPGPVVVVLPEDVLTERTTAPVIPHRPSARSQPYPADTERAVELLTTARSPVVIVGRCGWSEAGLERLRTFAESSAIPVATTVRCQDLIDNSSPAYVGTLGLRTTPGLDRRLEGADLVVLLGTRPDALSAAELPLKGGSGSAEGPAVVHVYPEPTVLAHTFPSELAIAASPEAFLETLPENLERSSEREEWCAALRRRLVEGYDMGAADEQAAAFMRVFDKHAPTDAVLTMGAGNYTAWAQRHHRYTVYPSQVATQSGAMGYGVPAAVAAAFAQPDRKVVAFAGDGCFLMTGQELATMARYRLDVLTVVVNNSRYGTIRDHQERHYPGRVSGTGLTNPDFVQLAQSFGAAAARVGTAEEFSDALAKLLDTPGPSLIEIEFDMPATRPSPPSHAGAPA